MPIHSLHAQSSAAAATVHPASRIGAASPGRPSSIGGSSPSISVLGKALAEAVQRAEKRDKESSPAELKALAERTGRNVFDGDWQRGGDIGGVERPKGADAARVGLSENVDVFMERFNASWQSPSIRQDNPFFGSDRAALVAIQYDDSGAFTVNERRAAFIESNRQYSEWAEQACAKGSKEHASTGKLTNFLKDVLLYFDAMPAIEKAIAPNGYAERLRERAESSESPDSSFAMQQPTMLRLLRWLGIAR